MAGTTNLGHLEAWMGLNTIQLGTGLRRAQAMMREAGKRMQKMGRTLTLAVSLPLAIMGGTAISTFAKYEAAMNQVRAVSGATERQFQDLSKAARTLGATTKFTATQAAEGMNFLSMAGFEVHEVMTAIPAVLNLAAAGNMELARAADIASNIMQGFGIEAKRTAEVTDILTKTFTSSNTSLEQMGEAMAYVAPVAKAFGQSIHTAAAAVGLLGDAGIQGSRAGTALRQSLIQLDKKSARLGISVRKANGDMMDMADILANIERSGIRTDKVISILGPRAGVAMAAMLDRGSGALRRFSEELEWSRGLTERIANIQMQGLKGAAIELKSAMQELAISGVGPLSRGLEGLVDWIKKGVIQLSKMDENTKKLTLAAIAFGIALGPVIWALGSVLTLIAGITWPIMLVIAAVAALSAAFLYIANNWQAIIERIGEWSWWRIVLVDMMQFFIEYNPFSLFMKHYLNFIKIMGFTPMPNIFEQWADGLERLKRVPGETFVPFQTKFGTFSEAIADSVDFVKQKVLDMFDSFTKGGGAAVELPAFIPKFIGKGLENVKRDLQEFGTAYEGVIGRLIAALRGLEYWQKRGGVAGIIKEDMDLGIASLQKVNEELQRWADEQNNILQGVLNSWQDWRVKLQDIWDATATGARMSFSDLKEVMWTALGKIEGAASMIAGAFVQLGTAIGESLGGAADDFATPLQRILIVILDFAKQLGGILVMIGTFMVLSGLFAGIGWAVLAAGMGLVIGASAGTAAIRKNIRAKRTGGGELTTTVRGLQSGGFITEGGVFKVGERGTELVHLPAGAAVTPANITRDKGGADQLSFELTLRKLIIRIDRERRRMRK